jgi:predicted nucleic-acid-binding protein
MRFTIVDIPTQYEKAKKLIFQSENTKFLVSDTAIVEYIHALSAHYYKTREQIAEMVAYLLSLRELICNDAVIAASLKHYVDHPKLSFEDCYLAEMANQNNAEPLYTFDRKLAAQHQSVELL